MARSCTEGPYVFPGPGGDVLDYSNFRQGVFVPAVARFVAAGGKALTFHDLRHTHVAWLIDGGWWEYRIVRRLGWKDGRILYTTYGHLFKPRNAELMRALEQRWDAARVSPAGRSRDGASGPKLEEAR